MAGLACLLHHAFIAQFCIHCLLTLSSVDNHATAEAAASGFRTFLQFLSKRFSSFLFLFSFFESWRNVALFKAMRRSGLFSSTYTPPTTSPFDGTTMARHLSLCCGHAHKLLDRYSKKDTKKRYIQCVSEYPVLYKACVAVILRDTYTWLYQISPFFSLPSS